MIPSCLIYATAVVSVCGSITHVNDAVRWSNADWLACSPELGRKRQSSSLGMGEAWGKKDKKTKCSTQTEAAVDAFC